MYLKKNRILVKYEPILHALLEPNFFLLFTLYEHSNNNNTVRILNDNINVFTAFFVIDT